MLSPHLFNVYLNPLLRDFNQASTVLRAFADDLLLHANDHVEAAHFLEAIYAWSTPRRLNINAKKTLVLGPPGPPLLLPSGERIVEADEATYLGIHVTAAGLDWPTHFQQKITECKKHLYLMMHVTAAWPFTARAAVFDTFLRPLLEYGSDLFVRSTLDPNGNIIKHHTVWQALLDFQKMAAMRIFKKKAFKPFYFDLLRWHPWLDRWREMAWWHTYNTRTATTALPHFLRIFEADMADRRRIAIPGRRFPFTTTRQRFGQFYKSRCAPLREGNYFLHRQLSAEEQHHVFHMQQRTFSYGATCLCGQPFAFPAHERCLPSPFGALADLFAAADWPAVKATMNLWWGDLHPSIH